MKKKYTYTLKDRNHRSRGKKYAKAREALDAMERDHLVEYIDRSPHSIVIARRTVYVNPVWEKEFVRHGDEYED